MPVYFSQLRSYRFVLHVLGSNVIFLSAYQTRRHKYIYIWGVRVYLLSFLEITLVENER